MLLTQSFLGQLFSFFLFFYRHRITFLTISCSVCSVLNRKHCKRDRLVVKWCAVWCLLPLDLALRVSVAHCCPWTCFFRAHLSNLVYCVRMLLCELSQLPFLSPSSASFSTCLDIHREKILGSKTCTQTWKGRSGTVKLSLRSQRAWDVLGSSSHRQHGSWRHYAGWHLINHISACSWSVTHKQASPHFFLCVE